MEVSARWKRTWKGEVIMTIVMPENVIDTEVYVKTSKEHIGIQMDPWISCSWKRTWSSTHPPNTQTKEKIRKFRLLKAGRRISQLLNQLAYYPISICWHVKAEVEQPLVTQTRDQMPHPPSCKKDNLPNQASCSRLQAISICQGPDDKEDRKRGLV